tara:strand:+ start:312 stop:1253 length:942 start_codon:yes stop_codon:yes gene_type:complete
MANNKYSGYSPKKEETAPNEGAPGSGTRLDRVNPYEFRKGMDIELTELGVSRLAESTPEEREKCTETVLKNLEEYQAYYSCLIQYQTEYRNKDNKPTFKKYLAEKAENNLWQEVSKEGGNDKRNQMEEPKYDKSLYTLKEAIKKEVINLLNENDDKEPPKSAKKDPSAMGAVALQKEVTKTKKEIEKLTAERTKIFNKFKDKKSKPSVSDERKKELSKEYIEVIKEKGIQKDIDEKTKYLEKLKKVTETKALEERELNREVAKTMMERKTHLSLLEIIKEAGVPMNEGSAGVKMYYEIAKIAYQEGMLAGLNK